MRTIDVQMYHYLVTERSKDSAVPEAIFTMYYALLEEGGKATCRKKWFKNHWVVNIADSTLPECGFKFHLTPDQMWWECYW